MDTFQDFGNGLYFMFDYERHWFYTELEIGIDLDKILTKPLKKASWKSLPG